MEAVTVLKYIQDRGTTRNDNKTFTDITQKLLLQLEICVQSQRSKTIRLEAWGLGLGLEHRWQTFCAVIARSSKKSGKVIYNGPRVPHNFPILQEHHWNVNVGNLCMASLSTLSYSEIPPCHILKYFHAPFLKVVMNACALLSLLWLVVVGTAKALPQRHVLRLQTYAYANVWQRC